MEEAATEAKEAGPALSWALVESVFSVVVQLLSCVQLFVTPWTAAL